MTQQTSDDPSVTQPHPRRWAILAVLCLSLLVLGIDNLIVQVALPTIQSELGASATVRVDAYPDRVFQGEVVRLGNAATSEFALLPSPNPSGNFTKVTQRLPVRMAIDQEGSLLRPGMMVELTIDIAD